MTIKAMISAKAKDVTLKFSLCGLLAVVLSMVFTANPAIAQSVTLDIGEGGDGTLTGRIIQIVALMTILSLAPGILIMMTSFTRIVVVLSFLRTAIGIQQTPPNIVLISLALFMTFFIMAPTFNQAYQNGILPLVNEEMDEMAAFNETVKPFKTFMLEHTREEDLVLFTEMSGETVYDNPMDIPLQVLVPSFMISELRRAFEIGFMLFLPFLIIDMVTAAILMAMGMMMLPPITISLPFKIIFFVIVDGWYLITGSLLKSYGL